MDAAQRHAERIQRHRDLAAELTTAGRLAVDVEWLAWYLIDLQDEVAELRNRLEELEEKRP